MAEVEEETTEEVVEEAVVHMKMEFISHMSFVTLNIKSGPQSQTIHGKGSLSTQYAKNSWQIKRGALPAL